MKQELREPPLLSGNPYEYPDHRFGTEALAYHRGREAERDICIKWMKENCYLKAERELPDQLNRTCYEGLRAILHHYSIDESLLDRAIGEAQQDMRKEVDGVSFKACEEFKD